MIAAALTLAPLATGAGLAATRAGGGLDVAAMMPGRRVEEVRRLLPAIFGLCRSVQDWALALALQEAPPPRDDLRRDMIRDHLARLCLHLPPAAGLAPLPLPPGWQAGGQALRQAAFGGALPGPADWQGWLASAHGLAPLARAVADAFAPGEAATAVPPADPLKPFDPAPVENTLAARHAGHPLLMHVKARHGHGPLVHLVARLIDLNALSRDEMPAPRRLPDGTALVPCSRGQCALRLRHAGGMVTAFERRTPTDDLLRPGGMLDAALATLPPGRADRAPLLLALLDPCLPVTLGGDHA